MEHVSIGSMTCLDQLDLSWNSELEGKLPTNVGKLCELRSIDLTGMKLNQSISHIFEILSGCSSHVLLESLSFTSCHLSGELPDRLEHFKNLKQLSLSYNSISGLIPSSVGQLSNLQTVDIRSNVLEGVVSENHFANLTKLRMFYALDNSLVLQVDPNWIPPFQLGVLELGSWQIGPSFPLWLASQKHLQTLDISNSSISDAIPSWFWTFSTQFFYVDLSNNQISGHVLYPSKSLNHCKILDLSFNNFSGRLSRLPLHFDPYVIDLSNNHFSGSLSHSLLYDQLNHTMHTMDLVLSNNLLSGEIPDCWIKWHSLEVLHLDGNRFSGKIPSSMGTLTGLDSLHLHNNMVQGEIPLSLKNCTNLVAINLAKNELDGGILGWLGYGLRSLRVLILRSNKLQGNIPDHLCSVTSLQILNIADNNISGSIPRCISNFTAMASRNTSTDSSISYLTHPIEGVISEFASVAMKRQILEYGNTLNLVRLVDLSCNNLSGEIPKEVTSLHGLQSLNLSRNQLTGKIPEHIGAMVSLETLDLSQSQLYGSIPESMSSMTFLSNLDLSSNNFSGRIPTSSQLQGFNETCYAGNHLCEPPLKGCRGSSGKEPDVKTGARGIRKGHEIK